MAKSHEILVEEKNQIPKVDEVELFAHDKETGTKAIVDLNTMETICVVKKDNRIIQHQHVIDEVNKLDNYIVKKTTLAHNGRVLTLELTEREPKQVELLPKDVMECGAHIINDYGKSRGLSVQGYGIRLVCSNGMVGMAKATKMQVDAYGTAEFAAELEEQIKASLDVWKEVGEVMQRANEIKVSIKDIYDTIDFLPKKYMDLVIDKFDDQETLYKIWNTYTEVITHEIGPKVQTAGRLSLLKRANKILEITTDYKETQ